MNWKTILSLVLGKSESEIKSEYGKLPRIAAARISKHNKSKPHTFTHDRSKSWSRNYERKQKTRRLIAKASQRRNGRS